MLGAVERRRPSMQETLCTIGNELETRHAQQAPIEIAALGVTRDSRGELDAY